MHLINPYVKNENLPDIYPVLVLLLLLLSNTARCNDNKLFFNVKIMAQSATVKALIPNQSRKPSINVQNQGAVL